MMTAIAATLFAAAIVPPKTESRKSLASTDRRNSQQRSLFSNSLLIAGVASALWTGSAVAVLVLTFSLLAGQPLSASEQFTRGFFDYVISVETGQAWVVVVLIAALFNAVVLAARSTSVLLSTSLIGLVAIVPISLVGHSASDENHMAAVNSFFLHFLGLTLWAGGLFVLLLLVIGDRQRRHREVEVHDAGDPEPILVRIVRRYSALAGVGLVLTASSGVINALLRLNNFDDLVASDYGRMLMLKVLATGTLAIIGWSHRRWLIPSLRMSSQTLRKKSHQTMWRLICVEVLIMSAIIGLSVVLGRTSPPGDGEEYITPSPARILTGYNLPPEPEWMTWITQWRPDWLWIVVGVMLSGWYLRTVWKLRAQGQQWPLSRLLSWLMGAMLLIWLSSSGPAVYGQVLFSAHIVQHMLLTFAVPMLLVKGSPVVLAMQTLPSRQDRTQGPREWVQRFHYSRVLRTARHPIVAAPLLGLATLLFYFTPLFRFSLEYHLGHELMILTFLFLGCLFIQALRTGRSESDQRRKRRAVALAATAVSFTMLSVYLAFSTTLIEPEWFGTLYPDWDISPLLDQQVGGKLLALFPTLVLGRVSYICSPEMSTGGLCSP